MAGARPSLIPFIAYLGVGLALAMVYASGRAERRQHRGLTLTSMAVGIAAALQTGVMLIEVPGALERGDDLSTELGVYVALLGAVLWAIGSGVLAKEVEGSADHDVTVDLRDRQTTAPRQDVSSPRP